MTRGTGNLAGTRMRRPALALACLAALAACSSGSAGAGGSASQSPSPSITASCISPGTPLAKRVVHFPSADGRQSVEAYVNGPGAHSASATSGSGTVGIVIDHQSGQSLCDSMGWADNFAAQGFLAIAPSLDEDNPVTETEGAVKYLRAHGATRIVLLGASMGGTVVLQTASDLQPPVQAVISVSGPTAYNTVDAQSAVPKLTVPVFYAAAANDYSFAANATTLYGATAEKDKTLDIVPDLDLHGFDLFSTLLDRINAFIQAHIKQ